MLSKDGDSKLTTAAPANAKSYLGMNLSAITKEEREKLEIKSGAKVESIEKGIFEKSGVPKGFIITHINNERVYSPQGAISLLSSLSGAIVLEGKTKLGEDRIFAVKLPQKGKPNAE